MSSFSNVEENFKRVAPQAEFCSLRFVHTRTERLAIERGVVQKPAVQWDSGAMVTLYDGGLGYCATADTSASGLRHALERARRWAQASSGYHLIDLSMVARSPVVGEYVSPVAESWDGQSLANKLDLLQLYSRSLNTDDRVVDWHAAFWFEAQDTLYLTADGSRVAQHRQWLLPELSATVMSNGEVQTRTFGGHALLRQGGLEMLDQLGVADAANTLTDDALQLLVAENCPTGTFDVLLAPDQMILQIHESIGHPLELDRILGDERNYAGTSFVNLEMFGQYQYGSSLLNVTCDPRVPNEAASYAFDDDGSAAQREYVIRDGILLRPLSGRLSQRRAHLEPSGIATSRATSWNRAPIDRMANLNVEPGSLNLAQIIASIEDGLYLKTNRSWSIDDSRNKFQFGCEWGQRIKDGELTTIVKNPNYRGISAEFWRNLSAVGDLVECLGTPFCGKGEPNQVIAVGHASPACAFSGVSVFGGQ